MGEDNGLNRRKEDIRFAQFIGEIEEWKKDSIEWRTKTDRTLNEISEFMDEIRTPRKIIIWTIRAFVIAALGSIATALLAFIRGHVAYK